MSQDGHVTRRCVYIELGFSERLDHPNRDFAHVDEVCEQLYMDALGHGFNWEIARRRA